MRTSGNLALARPLCKSARVGANWGAGLDTGVKIKSTAQIQLLYIIGSWEVQRLIGPNKEKHARARGYAYADNTYKVTATAAANNK